VLPRLSDGAYDMVFCDADARDYADYLTAALRLLRVGGVVAFNNALLAGPPDYAGADEPDGDTSLDLASHVRMDDRLVPVLLPLGDGLLAAGDSAGAKAQFHHSIDAGARTKQPVSPETRQKLAALEGKRSP